MPTPSGFESAAAILVETIAAHNVELQHQLMPIKPADAATAANILKPWYEAALVMVKTAQDPKQK